MKKILRLGLLLVMITAMGCGGGGADIEGGSYLRYYVQKNRQMVEYEVSFTKFNSRTLEMRVFKQGAISVANNEERVYVDRTLKSKKGTAKLEGLIPYWVPPSRRRKGVVFERMRAAELVQWERWKVVEFSDGSRTARYDVDTGFLVNFVSPKDKTVATLVASNITGLN